MIQIAVGVCLGIVGAVFILKWIGSRQRAKATRRGMEMLHPGLYPKVSPRSFSPLVKSVTSAITTLLLFILIGFPVFAIGQAVINIMTGVAHGDPSTLPH